MQRDGERDILKHATGIQDLMLQANYANLPKYFTEWIEF